MRRESSVIRLRLRPRILPADSSGRRPAAMRIASCGLLLALAFAQSACSHLVSIKASEPIVIQLDVKIEQAVRVEIAPEASSYLSALMGEPTDGKTKAGDKPASPQKSVTPRSKEKPPTIQTADSDYDK